MSLTGTGSILGQALAQDIAAALGTGTPGPTEIALWTVVANRLISHITANAQVNTTDTIDNVTTVISPAGACTGFATGSGVGTIL